MRKFIISRKHGKSSFYRNYWPSGKLQDFLDSFFESEPEKDSKLRNMDW